MGGHSFRLLSLCDLIRIDELSVAQNLKMKMRTVSLLKKSIFTDHSYGIAFCSPRHLPLRKFLRDSSSGSPARRRGLS